MPSSASTAVVLERWNRKLHYYLGLYFLFFLWLFLLTGLLLNHGQWRLAQTANQRRETRYDQTVTFATGESDVTRARSLLQQLRLTGEIDLPPGAHAPGHFRFNVNRPKDASLVDVDLAQQRAGVQHFENGRMGVFRIFHTFSGSRYNAPGGRDWIVTTIWVVAMDALAAGLIVMVVGSYYMWYRLKRDRRLGMAVLGAGFLCCGLFLAGFFGR